MPFNSHGDKLKQTRSLGHQMGAMGPIHHHHNLKKNINIDVFFLKKFICLHINGKNNWKRNFVDGGFKSDDEQHRRTT
ncbi:unnamed protein product [Lactuca saligna]|uniref:Uncharacterized protein n=1 Tax=Lactuca saligna TaxID=75948 RepID=A0AA36EDD1_LACSI|nr:unnamed protein product [Lactuca saligna]